MTELTRNIASPRDETGANARTSSGNRVPWNIGDIVAAVFFLAAAIITALAAAQTVNSAQSSEDAVTVASGAIAAAVSLALAGAIARVSRLRVIHALGVTLAAAGVAATLSLAGGGLLGESDGDILGVPGAVFFFALVELVLLGTALLFTRVKYGAPLSAIGLVRTRGIRPYLSATGYWLLAVAAVGAWALSVQALDIDFFSMPNSTEEALSIAGGSLPLAIMIAGILGPIGEELFFRGFMLNGLRNRFGLKTSVVLSSIVFGSAHIVPGAIVATFFLGLALAWIYVRSRSLWPAIFAHCLQNTIAIVATALN